MPTPLVSIVLATYNGNSSRISECIESVLNQSFTNFEFIIINDASTNEIENSILNYQLQDKRVTYLKNDINLGLTQSLNKAISKSNGKYIARIDDDDIWCDRNKLKKQVEFMEQNPDYGLCGTGVICIDDTGKEFDRIFNRHGNEIIRKYISGSNQFAHSSIIMRKDIFDKIGGYIDNHTTKYTEDYDLWLRIGRVSKFNNLEIYGLKYRVRKGSISGNKKFYQSYNAFKTYLQYKNDYPNKLIGIIKHIINIFMPKKITNILVKLYK